MQYRHVLAAALLVFASICGARAQTAKTVAADVALAPFVVEADNADSLRSQSASCNDQLAAALSRKGVAVARNPRLSDENLQSAGAPWAVLGRITRDKEQFQLELRLLDVRSGDEMRSYFNSDKELQVACRAVDKVAERIAAFVASQKGSR
jgi:hypothetical protein